MLEEHVDTGMEGTYDSLTQNVWGLRYIDELVLRRTNANWNGGTDPDFTDTTDTEWEQYLHDHQFSVVAGVNRVGTLTFRVAYDAYGEARHSWARDIDGDGDVDSGDYNIANAARTKEIHETGYNSDADWNRDGEVTSTDVAAFGSTHHAGAIPAGLVAPRTSELTVGFCGYRFNPEIGAYTVRFRHYDPTPGVARWLERDPAGYVDGPSLYGYLGRSPLAGADSSGLSYASDFMTGWDYVKEYWYGKGLPGKVYYHITSVIVYTVVAAAVVETGGVAIASAGGYAYTAGSATKGLLFAGSSISGVNGARLLLAGAILTAGDLAMINANWEFFSEDEKEAIIAKYLAGTAAGGLLFAPGKAPWRRPGSSIASGTPAVDFPLYDGFLLGARSRKTLQKGEEFDRFGGSSGTFASPTRTPIEARSLPPGPPRRYVRYRVLKPIEVWEGLVTPWFGRRGYGYQYKLPRTIDQLIEDGCIEEIAN